MNEGRKNKCIIIHEKEDSDAFYLSKHLNQYFEITCIELDNLSAFIEFEYNFIEKHLSLKIKEQILNYNTFQKADFVINLLKESSTLVRSQIQKTKYFSEKEWKSSFNFLFDTLEAEIKNIWINSFSLNYNLSNKYTLLSFANSLDIQILPFTISNLYITFPNSQLICKSISHSNKVNTKEYYGSSLIKKEDRQAIKNHKQDSPLLLQPYIQKENEIRTYYLLGSLFSVSIKGLRNYVDIKDLSLSESQIDVCKIPKELSSKIRKFCRHKKLNYCCFEFLFYQNKHFLIDINISGAWSYMNPIIESFVSWYSQVLKKCSKKKQN